MFSPETGGVFNYLTLSVSDKTVRTEVQKYRAAEFNRLFVIFNFFSAFNFAQQVITYSTDG